MFHLDEEQDQTATSDLRKGWTTGSCATAASVGALLCVLGKREEMVAITLPSGAVVEFALHEVELVSQNHAYAVVEKDAGDDPDVTHGALIRVDVVTVAGASFAVKFFRGRGVGVITKAGLPLAVGEPAINPKPREMMRKNLSQLADEYGYCGEISLTISVENGEFLASKTWNPRLGIQGGLSILGTTGIVKPYSCSAWIHSIHRGIDILRAAGADTVVGATGKTSERVAMEVLGVDEGAVVDMGDFVGGMLKYLRRHPIDKVVIAGGVAKLTKLAQGALDLHNKRSTVDFGTLSEWALVDGLEAGAANWIAHEVESVGMVVERFGGERVASWILPRAQNEVEKNLSPGVSAAILVVSRDGMLLSRSGAKL